MPDAIFADPRLAAVYDAFDDDRGDLPAYLALAAELSASRVLDVGCGTGSLAVLLARHGYQVTGVDPAEASLRIAARKPFGEAVTWIHGDAGAVPPIMADVAFMTGNVAQVFLTDDDWLRTLRAVHAALRPGGHLVFETRRPERRAWEEWAADTGPMVREVAGERVERRLAALTVDLPFVSFRTTYRFGSDGAVLTSESTLRFRAAGEIEESLRQAGYDVADVRDAPDRPGREWVYLARRSA